MRIVRRLNRSSPDLGSMTLENMCLSLSAATNHLLVRPNPEPIVNHEMTFLKCLVMRQAQKAHISSLP